MQSKATTVQAYLQELPADRRQAIEALREVILQHIPEGFQETMSYGMIGYVVPHQLYPPGYHCKPQDPLPLMNIASQKNFIAIYHMGLYAQPALLDWFQQAHATASPKKLDMGKSCIRYKKLDDIPLHLIGELASKMTPTEWIALYEKNFKRAK